MLDRGSSGMRHSACQTVGRTSRRTGSAARLRLRAARVCVPALIRRGTANIRMLRGSVGTPRRGHTAWVVRARSWGQRYVQDTTCPTVGTAMTGQLRLVALRGATVVVVTTGVVVVVVTTGAVVVAGELTSTSVLPYCAVQPLALEMAPDTTA